MDRSLRLGRRLDLRKRGPAIARAFAAHERAEPAMLMLVLLAFLAAELADGGACLKQHPDDLSILAGAPHGDPGGRIADIRAIEAGADALAHIRLLGRAGVSAGGAQSGAEHRVAGRDRQFLIGIARDIRVKRDHLANGHGLRLSRARACGA